VAPFLSENGPAPRLWTYSKYEPPAAASTVVRLNGIRRSDEGNLRMVDGGPNRRWLSFSPKAGRFTSTIYRRPAAAG